MEALAAVLSALIVAGPTWLALRRAARRNNADHERGQGMLRELLDLTTEVRAWQLDHGHAHERGARHWRAFLAANPELINPPADTDADELPAVEVSTR